MFCTYCGDVATTIDHVPPQKLRKGGWAFDYKWLEVPACWPCNIALGAKPLMTVDDRRDWIAARLRRHYRFALKMPTWTDSELDCLGHSLRGMVYRTLCTKASVLGAIAFADSHRAVEPVTEQFRESIKLRPRVTKRKRVLGITTDAQAVVVKILSEHPDSDTTSIAMYCGLPPSLVSGVIGKLRSRGLVTVGRYSKPKRRSKFRVAFYRLRKSP